MRSAAAIAAEAGADLIDINMGCPVRKVCKTGAGAALLSRPRPRRRGRVARRREGSGLPVTVKLRSGLGPGDRAGFELAAAARRGGGRRGDRLPSRGRPPPSTRASPTTRWPASWPSGSTVPMIISGGLDTRGGRPCTPTRRRAPTR